MLIEIAIADAYGAGFEFDDPSEGRPNDLSFFVRNRRYHKLHPGMYTDDTQMSLAVAECLLEGTFDRRSFASSFLRAFQRDRRDGYARRFQAFLEEVENVDDLLERLKPDSERSGAAMRVSTIGLLADLGDVLEVCDVQARITHDTTLGVAAAKGAALMVYHQAHRLGPIEGLPAFLAAHVPEIDWSKPNRARTKTAGDEIIRAALAALLDSGSLSDILRISVGFGGDTDTVAAIAMGVASVSEDMKRDLPEVLYANLESGPYGIEYLREKDRQLASHFGVPIVAA